MEQLHGEIPEKTRNSPEFPVIYPRIRATVEEFSERARALARNGTTIRMTQDYRLPGAITVQVILEYPRKSAVFDKLSAVLKRKK